MDKTELCRGCPRYDERGLLGTGPKPCDVLFLMPNPADVELDYDRPFISRTSKVLTNAIAELAPLGDRYRTFSRYFAYSVRCGSAKIDGPSRDKCAPQVIQEIHAAKPKVIVPLGLDAVKTLGLKARTIKEVASKELTVSLNGIQYKVLPSLHPYMVSKETGLYATFKADIKRAVDYAYRRNARSNDDDMAELTAKYVIPETLEAAEKLLKEIRDYSGDEAKKGDPDKWLISVDTETNTLYPHSPGAKVIMISIGWDEGKAMAIPLDHKDAPYDWTSLRPLLAEILSGPKPKAFHNAKFDLKFLEHVLGIQVNNLAWDSMLAEHLLDEAKRGYYGLKSLTTYYAPEFVGYENRVKECLNTQAENLNSEEDDEDTDGDIAAEPVVVEKIDADADLETQIEQAIALLDQLKLDGAPLRKRRGTLKSKATRGCSSPEDNDALYKVSRELVLIDARTAEYKEALKALKKKAKDRAALIRKKGDAKSFEDIPIQTLLLYAAIDADLTRRISKAQVKRFTKPLYHVMQTYALPGSRVLGNMEHVGFDVDNDYLAVLEKQFTKLVAEYETNVHTLAGGEFNVGSTKELSNLLFMDLGLPITATSEKTGAPKTDKATLGDLSENQELPEEQRNLCRAVLDWRECTKALTGFIRGKTGIYELSRLDGRIHTQFNINGTSTGRLSSARKNL